MRRAATLLLLFATGGANAAPLYPVQPVASHFDLTSSMIRSPMMGRSPSSFDADSRWLLHDLTPPPGSEPHQPKVRIHGRKVKFRIPL